VSRVGIEGASLDAVTRKNMLKVTLIETHDQRRLVLEGALVQPWISELERVWSAAGDELAERRLVVDLDNVTTISKEGENTLFELMRVGAKFSCGGVLTRYLVGQLALKCQISIRDVMNRSSSGD
jgi:hypothetical protein